MGQFDSPSEAALARIKSEYLSSSPVDDAVERIANLGGMILEVAGFAGASGGIGFLNALKNLAVNKDEGNLIYFGDALVDDIRSLYRLYKELKQQFDERISSPEFSAVVANATLHITRTNVESRLKRLAHLIVNGVKENDLEPESLDDMMRAAVGLKDEDIITLSEIYEMQIHLFSSEFLQKQEAENYNQYATLHNRLLWLWGEWWKKNLWRFLGMNGLLFNNSCARLQANGIIAPIGQKAIAASPAPSEYVLLLDGKKFYERLQEISIQ